MKIPFYERHFESDKYLGKRPPPPPLPEYDPEEEAPKWDKTRVWRSLPVDRGPIPWTEIGTQPKSDEEPDWRGVIKKNVIEYPMPEPYKLGQPISTKYFWFDTPDYADPFKKLWFSFKWFSYTGAIIALSKMSFDGKSFIWSNNKIYIARYIVPWVAAGLSASTTVCLLANLRGKKDDQYNYTGAGIIFGTVMGRKHYTNFLRWTIAGVVCANIFKYEAERNGEIWPVFNWRRSTTWQGLYDGEHGLASGDMRKIVNYTTYHPDPGRDNRTTY